MFNLKGRTSLMRSRLNGLAAFSGQNWTQWNCPVRPLKIIRLFGSLYYYRIKFQHLFSILYSIFFLLFWAKELVQSWLLHYQTSNSRSTAFNASKGLKFRTRSPLFMTDIVSRISATLGGKSSSSFSCSFPSSFPFLVARMLLTILSSVRTSIVSHEQTSEVYGLKNGKIWP